MTGSGAGTVVTPVRLEVPQNRSVIWAVGLLTGHVAGTRRGPRMAAGAGEGAHGGRGGPWALRPRTPPCLPRGSGAGSSSARLLGLGGGPGAAATSCPAQEPERLCGWGGRVQCPVPAGARPHDSFGATWGLRGGFGAHGSGSRVSALRERRGLGRSPGRELRPHQGPAGRGASRGPPCRVRRQRGLTHLASRGLRKQPFKETALGCWGTSPLCAVCQPSALGDVDSPHLVPAPAAPRGLRRVHGESSAS